ncbi:MAG: 3-hydroxybutyryl-CoA dehydrogenase [Frankiales bacterium]|nr:3-hydroxybutyryl-CoA dehydrogenase [Frankiales bacterium]
MGSGIAEVFARAGYTVAVHEIDNDAAARGRARIAASVERAARSGKITEAAAEQCASLISVGTDLDALADASLVIEAASEEQSIKTSLFARLDEVLVRDDAILASNTSSIPIMKLGTVTRRPEQVIGMHFFNPVPVLPLVEIVPSLLTSPETVQKVQDLAETDLGKTVIRSQDRAGFIVNALLVPYLLSGVRMLESGFASAHDIDAGMVQGCAHPMGPLQLTDLIGLDTTKAIAESLYAEFKEPLFSPPPMLLRMVDAGLLGRKSGRGFYEYRT